MQSSSDLFTYPNDWSEQALEAVAEINPESLGSSTPPNFRFQYIDISSVNVGVIDWHSVTTHVFATAPSRARRIVRPGDVLLSTVRPGLQSHAFAEWEDSDSYICSTGFAVIRAGKTLEPRFLRHLVFNDIVTTQLHRLETGSNYPAVPESDVKLLRIPVPPLSEQRRISEILDAADEAIRQTERVIAKLGAVKAGLVHDLLTRGLDEHGRLRDPQAHPEQFKGSPLGRIPKEWDVCGLADVADVDRGKFAHRPRNDPAFYGGKCPFIQTGDVTSAEGGILETYSQTLNDRGAAVSREFPTGTIAITIAANIADTAILGRPIYFPDSIVGAVIRLPHNVRYVELCIRRAKSYLDAQAPQSAQKNINLEVLRPLLIAVPTPDEQKRIAAVYDAHDARIRAEEAELAKLRQVKRGLMDDLLTGQVRVGG